MIGAYLHHETAHTKYISAQSRKYNKEIDHIFFFFGVGGGGFNLVAKSLCATIYVTILQFLSPNVSYL